MAANDQAHPGDRGGGPYQQALTAGAFREVLQNVTDHVPLVVAVRDRNRFNTLIGDAEVTNASVTHGPHGPVVILDVNVSR